MSIQSKIIVLLIIAAILPLSVFGFVSILSTRQATQISILEGNSRLIKQMHDRIDDTLHHAIHIGQAIAENLNHPDLTDWQQSRILQNYTIKFKKLHWIRIMDINGHIHASSEITPQKKSHYFMTALPHIMKSDYFLSPVYIRADQTPALQIMLPLHQLGQINGLLNIELDLLSLWTMVDSMTIGKQGYISILTAQGNIIASGHPSYKKLVFQTSQYPYFTQLKSFDFTASHILSHEIISQNSQRNLIVLTQLIDPIKWVILIEQPIAEAFARVNHTTFQLILLIVVSLISVIIIGYIFSHYHILSPIKTLMTGIYHIGQGKLHYHIGLYGVDEFSKMAHSFNDMSRHLEQLQDNVRKQERLAVFGRVASGLMHDLKHPIQSIKNVTALMLRKYDDSRFRDTFERTIAREFKVMDTYTKNLHNLTHDIPFSPISLSINHILDECLSCYESEIQNRHIQIKKIFDSNHPHIRADRISLPRVLNNIISNAVDAINSNGCITITSELLHDDHQYDIAIHITDTGSGISENHLSQLFDEFITTKRSGLGLGLPLCKRILEQHNAHIAVKSTIDVGTTFTIYFLS